MTDKKQRFLLLFLLTLFLGGCSLLQIKLLREGNDSDCRKHENGASDKTLVNQYRSESIHFRRSHSLLYPDKGELEYNPMGGMNVTLVINGDKKLTIDTTVQMEDSGQFEQVVTVFQQN